MANRVRLIQEITYGHFGDYMKTWIRLDSIMRQRGWVTAAVLTPIAGPNNEFVAEFEYPDLATFEQENNAFYSDPEAFGAFQAGAEFVVQGTARTELYEVLPLEFFREE
ncbi:MAG: hypothetical protein FWC87_11660 [Acidimicrobiaceae bacterium]|nr:hypothetical protein [Acidimicrobiaceae bacterium]